MASKKGFWSVMVYALLIVLVLLFIPVVSHANEAVSYDITVMEDQPVGYWPLASTQSEDQTGKGHDGTFEGNPADTVMPNGDAAIAFNGIDQYFTIPDHDDLEVTSSGIMTIEAWMRPDTLQFIHEQSSGYVHWMGKGESGQHSWAARMYSYTNSENRPNRISGYSFNLAGGLGAGSYFQDAVSVGEWIHYTLVINTVDVSSSFPTGYTKLYKNGVLRDQDSLSGYNIIPGNGTAPIRIGTRDMASFFEGAVGKVALYNYELTEEQLLHHYHVMMDNAEVEDPTAAYTLSPLAVTGLTASSSSDGYVEGNTLDDDLGTRWSADGEGQWLVYDLGSPRAVDYAKIAWFRGGTRASLFQVEVSLDGEAWHQVYTGSSSGTTAEQEHVDLNDAIARYVRVTGNGNTQNSWNSITEFDLYGSYASLSAVTVHASMEEANNAPRHTLDDNPDTRWSAEGEGQWIEYDIGTPHLISHVSIAWFRGDVRASSFAIEVSPDGEIWAQVYRGAGSGATLEQEIYEFEDIQAQYIRVIGYGNTQNEWTSITELDIHVSYVDDTMHKLASIQAFLQDTEIDQDTLIAASHLYEAAQSNMALIPSQINLDPFSVQLSNIQRTIINSIQVFLSSDSLGKTDSLADPILAFVVDFAIHEVGAEDQRDKGKVQGFVMSLLNSHARGVEVNEWIEQKLSESATP